MSTHSKLIAAHYTRDNTSSIAVSSIDQIVEWALNKPTQAGVLARNRLGMKTVDETEENVEGGPEAEEDPELGKPAPLPGRLLVAILRERLGQLDCSDGLIIDGIDTAYSKSPETTATVLKVAFGPTILLSETSLDSNIVVDEGSEVGESDPQADQDGLPPLLDVSRMYRSTATQDS